MTHICTYSHSRNAGSGEPRCLECGLTEHERAETDRGLVKKGPPPSPYPKLPNAAPMLAANIAGEEPPSADPVGFELPFWFKYLDPTDMYPEDLPKYLKFAAQIPGDPQGLLGPGVGGALFDLRPDEIERAEGWIEQFAMPMGTSHWRLDPTQAWVIARYAKWLRGDL